MSKYSTAKLPDLDFALNCIENVYKAIVKLPLNSAIFAIIRADLQK